MNPKEKKVVALMAKLNNECNTIAERVEREMAELCLNYISVKISQTSHLAIHNIDGRICFASDRCWNNKPVWEQIDKWHGVTETDYGYFIPADRQTKMRFVGGQYDIFAELSAEQDTAISELETIFDI